MDGVKIDLDAIFPLADGDSTFETPVGVLGKKVSSFTPGISVDRSRLVMDHGTSSAVFGAGGSMVRGSMIQDVGGAGWADDAFEEGAFTAGAPVVDGHVEGGEGTVCGAGHGRSRTPGDD